MVWASPCWTKLKRILNAASVVDGNSLLHPSFLYESTQSTTTYCTPFLFKSDLPDVTQIYPDDPVILSTDCADYTDAKSVRQDNRINMIFKRRSMSSDLRLPTSDLRLFHPCTLRASAVNHSPRFFTADPAMPRENLRQEQRSSPRETYFLFFWGVFHRG